MIFFKLHLMMAWTGLGGVAAATGHYARLGASLDLALLVWFTVFAVIAVLPVRTPE